MTGGPRPWLARVEPRHVVFLAGLLALIAFLPSLWDGFVFDDLPLIVKNPFAHDWHHVGRCFGTDLWDTPERPDPTGHVRFYRPLVCASYIVNWKLSQAPWAFHAVNIALHVVATVLAARLALRFTGAPLPALLAAAVFAIHPSRNENVVWISGRTDLLMGFFLLGAVEAAVHAASRPRSSGRWVLAFGLWTLSVLSKEFAVCWPLLLAAEAASASQLVERRRLARASAGALVLAMAYLAVRSVTMPIRPPEVSGMALPLPLHVVYVFVSLGYYVERLFVPWPQTFDFRPVPLLNGAPQFFVPSVVLGMAAAVLLVAWLVRAARRDRTLAVQLLVTFGLFLPLLNVSYTGFPGTAADRFLYIPLLPLAAGAARDARGPIERWATRRLAPLVLFAVALMATAVIWVRSLDYVDDETWWRHEVEVNPDNPHALSGLVPYLRSDPDEAFRVVRRTLSPEALRFTLLATPARYYIALLELQGPRLADGNVTALETLLDAMRALIEGRPPLGPRRAGDLELLAPDDSNYRTHVANNLPHLATAAALVASRLGHDDLVREFALRVTSDSLAEPEIRYNLALALSRGGDYSGARQQLALGLANDASPEFRAAVADLDRTLAALQERIRRAGGDELALSVARGSAYLDLGAYLRAARALRPAYAANAAAVAPLYLQALVSARLDHDAEEVAHSVYGAKEAETELAKAREHLSPRTAHAVPPSPGEPWVEQR